MESASNTEDLEFSCYAFFHSQTFRSPVPRASATSCTVVQLPVGSAATRSSPCQGKTPTPASDLSGVGKSRTSDASGVRVGDHAHKRADKTRSDREAQNRAHLLKLEQLRKYIASLQEKIPKVGNYETKETDLRTLEYMLTAVLNPSFPEDGLRKCEEFLRKTSSTVYELYDMQLLNEAADFLIKTPIDNGRLQKMFNGPLQVLLGTVYPRKSANSPSPPPDRSCASAAADDGHAISDILQGEVAHLDPRFRVTLDPVQDFSSKATRILCHLDVTDFPKVPPITVTVPEDYPDSPPLFSASRSQYASTEFLADALRAFQDSMNKLLRPYSVTTLLNTWESSVRRSAEHCCRKQKFHVEAADAQRGASLAGSPAI